MARFALTLSLVLSLGACADVYRDRSCERIAEEYSAAVLVADNDTLRQLVASRDGFVAVGKSASLSSLHVIRSCPQSESQDGLIRRVLVLIGGGLKEAVFGFDVVAVKEGSVWRVQDAEIAKDSNGSPKMFLRNCNVDLSRTGIQFGGQTPEQIFVPILPGGPASEGG